LRYCVKHYTQIKKHGSIQKDKSKPIAKSEIESLYYDHLESAVDIAKIRDCSEAHVRRLMDGYGLKRRSKSEAFKLKYDKNPHRGFIKPKLMSSPVLAYILGVLLGDSWVSRSAYNYKVGMRVIEKDFADSFFNALCEINLNPFINKYEINKINSKWRDQWLVVANSKQFYIWYKGLSFKDIESIISGYESDFIRGYYESDGTLAHRSKNNWRVSIYSSHQELIQLAKKIINKINLSCSIRSTKRNGKKREYTLDILGGQKETVKFFGLINPVIKAL